MMTSASKYPTPEDFYALDAETTKQTIEESSIAMSVNMGAFTVHHGTRYGRPIVIAEHHNQKAGELSAVWYSDVPVSY